MGLHCQGRVNPFAGVALFIPWRFWKVPTAPLGSAGAEGSGGQGCAPIPQALPGTAWLCAPQCAPAQQHQYFGTSSQQPTHLWDAPCELTLWVPPAPFCRGAAPSLGLSRSQDTKGTARRQQPCSSSWRCWGSSVGPTGSSSTHSQPCPCTTQRCQGLLGSWGSRGDAGGQRGGKGDCTECPSDVAAAPQQGSALAPLVCAQVAPSCCPSTPCFLFKQGHSDDTSTAPRRQEYLGALPARSSLPARPPAVCTFTGNRNLRHRPRGLNASSKSHLKMLPASPSARGRNRLPETLNH